MFKSRTFKYFALLYSIVLCIALVTLCIINKGDFVILLNKHANHFLDIFFQATTLLGLGGVFAIFIILMIFKKYSYAIAGTVSLILTGLFTYLFKQILFKGMPRPTGYFQNNELHHFIEGFSYHQYNSFPSGHTMTIFALAFFLALIIKDSRWSTVLFIIALLVGISRVYLLQHFLMDITMGSFLGLISTWLGFLIAEKLENRFPKLKSKLKISFKR